MSDVTEDPKPYSRVYSFEFGPNAKRSLRIMGAAGCFFVLFYSERATGIDAHVATLLVPPGTRLNFESVYSRWRDKAQVPGIARIATGELSEGALRIEGDYVFRSPYVYRDVAATRVRS